MSRTKIVDSRMFSLVVIIIASSASFICAGYAYMGPHYTDTFNEFIIDSNDSYILNTDGFDLGQVDIKAVWHSETTKSSNDGGQIKYTDGKFVNSAGEPLTALTAKVGTITLKNADGSLLTGEGSKLSATLSDKKCSHTDASSSASAYITDGETAGEYDVYIKYMLITLSSYETTYSLPGYTVTVVYNNSI